MGNVQVGDKNLGVVSIERKVEGVKLHEITKDVSKDRKRSCLSSASWGTRIVRVERGEETPAKTTKRKPSARKKVAKRMRCMEVKKNQGRSESY